MFEGVRVEKNHPRPDAGSDRAVGGDNPADDSGVASFTPPSHSMNKTLLTTSETTSAENQGQILIILAENPIKQLRIASMTRTIKCLNEQLAKERKEKCKLKKENKKTEREKSVLGSKISKVFNKDQLDSLRRGSNRGSKWSNETIKKALQIRFASSSTGHYLLLEQHQPSSSLRSLRRRLECVSMEPGMLEEVFDILRIKVAFMKPEKRERVLLNLR